MSDENDLSIAQPSIVCVNVVYVSLSLFLAVWRC